MKIVLQPSGSAASRAHYADTIETPVKLSAHAAVLVPVLSDLNILYPGGVAPVWGVTPGKDGQNQTKYNRVDIGDLVAFSREGEIFALGTVAFKFHSADFAKTLWGSDDSGMTWEFIYFLDEIRKVSIPYVEFNAAVGYAPNFVIQGFNVLDENRSADFIEYLGIHSDRHQPRPSETDASAAANRLTQLSETDRERKVSSRIEQSYLRSLLFSGPTSKCAICSKEYPIDLLRAAHIKKRSACTAHERIDRSIVMSACVFGCDELFERGYIGISEQGAIVMADAASSFVTVAQYIRPLIGTQCLAFCEQTKKHFDWHREHKFLD